MTIHWNQDPTNMKYLRKGTRAFLTFEEPSQDLKFLYPNCPIIGYGDTQYSDCDICIQDIYWLKSHDAYFKPKGSYKDYTTHRPAESILVENILQLHPYMSIGFKR